MSMWGDSPTQCTGLPATHSLVLISKSASLHGNRSISVTLSSADKANLWHLWKCMQPLQDWLQGRREWLYWMLWIHISGLHWQQGTSGSYSHSLEQSGMERLLKCWHKKTDKQSSQRMLSIPYIQICSQNDIHAVLPKLPILTAQCMQ